MSYNTIRVDNHGQITRYVTASKYLSFDYILHAIDNMCRRIIMGHHYAKCKRIHFSPIYA